MSIDVVSIAEENVLSSVTARSKGNVIRSKMEVNYRDINGILTGKIVFHLENARPQTRELGWEFIMGNCDQDRTGNTVYQRAIMKLEHKSNDCNSIA